MSNLLKPFTHIDEQIQILQKRSLVISDNDEVRAKLLHHNYYTIINGYKYPFINREKTEETFIEGTTFDEIFALYTFDCKFRALLLKYILKVEHQLKSVISHYFAKVHQDEKYPDYLRKENFDVRNDNTLPPKKAKRYKALLKDITDEMDKQRPKNEMIEHYMNEYDNIPPWILVSIFSFGMLSSFYYCLSNKDQNEIAKVFGLPREDLASYLKALNIYRNSCAHDERIYSKPLRSKVVRKDMDGNKLEYTRVYVVILILKDLLDATSFMSFYSQLNDHIAELERCLKSIKVDAILNAMGMPLDEAVRMAELGPLERGDALSDEEFKEVLKRYIIPILPINASLCDVVEGDVNKSSHTHRLVSFQHDTIYFAQGINSAFVYCIPVNGATITQELIEDVEEHLSTLINYIHIFWNLSNLSAHSRDKVAIAFPALCEQAYELAICKLMCQKDSRIENRKYAEESKEYKRRIGQEDEEARKELTKDIHARRKEVALLFEREAVAGKTLYGILSQIETWATKTYEGQKKTFGIVLCANCLPTNSQTFDYVDFLKSDYSATINDGLYSAVELFADGSFKAHLTISNEAKDQLPSIPYPYSGFAQLCDRDRIGIILTDTGDILIINDRKLCYTKHNGRWLCSMADKVIDQITKEVATISQKQAEAIYQAVVDVSYSRGGACIGIIRDSELPAELHDMIGAGLLSTEELSAKLLALKSLISTIEGEEVRQKHFYELDRALRRELLELDGAMVLSSNGKIHVIGTIIKLDGSGSDGGGRTAAAKQLSQYGLAIKVSQDGYVQLFKDRLPILEVMT